MSPVSVIHIRHTVTQQLYNDTPYSKYTCNRNTILSYIKHNTMVLYFVQGFKASPDRWCRHNSMV